MIVSEWTLRAPTAASLLNCLDHELEGDAHGIVATDDFPGGDHSINVYDVKSKPCPPLPVLTLKVALKDLDLSRM